MLADCDSSGVGYHNLIFTLETIFFVIRTVVMSSKIRRIPINDRLAKENPNNQEKLLHFHEAFKFFEKIQTEKKLELQILEKEGIEFSTEDINKVIEPEHEQDMKLIDQYFRYVIDWKVADLDSFRHIFEEREKFKSVVENLDEEQQDELILEFRYNLFDWNSSHKGNLFDDDIDFY